MLPTQKTPPKHDLADLTVLTYGRPKVGKSSFCAQAEGALFLATEAGLNHLETFQAPINSWDDMLAACAEVAAGKHQFKTVIIDTVDNAYRLCTEHVCRTLNIKHESEASYGRAYAMIGNEFTRVLTKLSLLPYGLYLISHAQDTSVETRTGTITRVVPTLPEKARKIVLALVDMILFVDMEAHTDEQGESRLRRVIRTKPTMHYEAGDRTGKLPETLDLDYRVFMKAFQSAMSVEGSKK
ncbi:MAG: ATP-binding protein [Armatimonadota bacterium]